MSEDSYTVLVTGGNSSTVCKLDCSPHSAYPDGRPNQPGASRSSSNFKEDRGRGQPSGLMAMTIVATLPEEGRTNLGERCADSFLPRVVAFFILCGAMRALFQSHGLYLRPIY